MRANLPLTGVEYILKDTETVVSKTDLEGRITYANQDFIHISGYTEDELIGAPQNIVRHPDMPAEAFADFWRTLKSGKAWTGIVKNRCKNGDHYWVEASAAPVIENGRITGYTSVRIKPSREQVAAAEQIYRDIKAGKRGLVIREGHVIQRSAWSCLNFVKALSLKAKMRIAFGVLAALFAINIGTAIVSHAQYGNALAVISVAGLMLAVLLCAILYRSIVVPLEQAKRDMDRMSAGDLSAKIRVDGNDEIANVLQAARILQTNVKLLVGQIKEATDLVNSGSRAIAEGNADLAARTDSQASSLQETASSIEQLTGTVKQNADHAHSANDLVIAASTIALKGGETMDEVIGMMSSIRDSARRISDIIGVIDSIAFQTNILALNAAVEAARAGEQGRGFAVVAGEVRSLAQRSSAAAKEIKELISNSVNRVEDGNMLVDKAGKTMDEIVSSITSVTEIMSQITLASREQSIGIEQVNQAVTQMDKITQQNAALVEHSAAAAETLQQQAMKQAQLVGAFKLVSQEERTLALH